MKSIDVRGNEYNCNKWITLLFIILRKREVKKIPRISKFWGDRSVNK
jgi:hypothetical protein